MSGRIALPAQEKQGGDSAFLRNLPLGEKSPDGPDIGDTSADAQMVRTGYPGTRKERRGERAFSFLRISVLV
jgi:hypothetical protein